MGILSKMRKIVPTILTLGAIMLVSSAQAADSSNPEYAQKPKEEIIKLDKSQALWDKELQKWVIPMKKVKGKLVPLSETEKQTYIEETDSISSVSATEMETLNEDPNVPEEEVYPERDYYEYWKYTEATNYDAWLPTRKVTADINCTSTGGCAISKIVGVTVGATYSASISAEKNAIAAGASYSWNYSLQDTSTYTFNLAYGDSGYIGFRPLTRKTAGRLKKYSNWDGFLYEKEAWGYSPKKTYSGEADGKYMFIYY